MVALDYSTPAWEAEEANLVPLETLNVAGAAEIETRTRPGDGKAGRGAGRGLEPAGGLDSTIRPDCAGGRQLPGQTARRPGPASPAMRISG